MTDSSFISILQRCALNFLLLFCQRRNGRLRGIVESLFVELIDAEIGLAQVILDDGQLVAHFRQEREEQVVVLPGGAGSAVLASFDPVVVDVENVEN